jgi:2,3-bisphosphoglycerate-dependent phosphoglycerate mutase
MTIRNEEGQMNLDHIAHSVILVRHGITDFNQQGRIQGMVDIPLNETGLLQVEETAKELSRHYLPEKGDSENGRTLRKCVVVSSDLSRAMQSAHAFVSKFPTPPEIHPDPRARERNFGEWEGMLVSDIFRQFPEDARAWQTGAGGELVHGAERRAHVGARGAEVVNEWAQSVDNDTDVIIFAHGAWIYQTIAYLFGAGDDEDAYRFLLSPRNAHWSTIVPGSSVSGELEWRLADFNHGPMASQFGDWEHFAQAHPHKLTKSEEDDLEMLKL